MHPEFVTSNNPLAHITIKGFKSIKNKKTLVLSNLTILAGNNSSGKSSFLQAPLLIKQTAESGFDPGPLLLDGPSVRFHNVKELLSRTDNRLRPGFFFSFGLSNGSEVKLSFSPGNEEPLIVDSTTFSSKNGKYTIKPNMRSATIRKNLPKHMQDIENLLTGDFEGESFDWVVERDRCFLKTTLASKNRDRNFSTVYSSSPTTGIMHMLRRAIHLPGLRGNPERLYPLTARSSEYPGTFEAYAASVLLHWQRDQKGKEKLSELELFSKRLGIATKIIPHKKDDTHVQIDVKLPGDPVNAPSVNIADVGLGVSQALPVLVALIEAGRNRLVLIEQPEIHLHPRGQLELGKIVAEIASRGTQVIVETHSSMFLLGVQTALADGKIDHEKVSLNWFDRDSSGATTIDHHQPERDGSYGDWAIDFDEAELKAEYDYFTAQGINDE